MEEEVGTSLRGLSKSTLHDLDLLLRGAESKGLRKTVRKVRKHQRVVKVSYQKSLDEFG